MFLHERGGENFMKKIIAAYFLIAFLFVFAVPRSLAMSDKAVNNKHDFSGDFEVFLNGNYDWNDEGIGKSWNYKIHIKEAMKPEFSTGTVHFQADGINVVGKVEVATTEYPYWVSQPGTRELNLFAAGTTKYEGEDYYFMMLYSDDTVWLALSKSDYMPYYMLGTVFPHAEREYQVHSNELDQQFLIDFKDIH